jgi:hypothetical protein
MIKSPSQGSAVCAVVVQSKPESVPFLASGESGLGHQPSKLVTRVQIPATAHWFHSTL